jgi:WhiB family redox-sensing transcriptional regulator
MTIPHLRLTNGPTADTLDLRWQEQALCAQTDPEAFFPEPGRLAHAAKRICARCDVRAECLQHALTHHEAYGIWGGLTPNERAALAHGMAAVDEADQDEAAAQAERPLRRTRDNRRDTTRRAA